MLCEERIRLLPVVHLIIVSAGIAVLMPGEVAFLAECPEERLDLIVYIGLDQGGAKTTVVFGVMDQQSGAWRAHRYQEGIVLALGEVGGIFFNLIGINRAHQV